MNRTKENLERSFKNFRENIIPKKIKNEKSAKFIQSAVSGLFESSNCYISDIARHIDSETQLKSREKWALEQLENTDTDTLNVILFQESLKHFQNQKFYLAIDETTIEKSYAKYKKNSDTNNKTLISPLEGLEYRYDNAKKDGDKYVRGYGLLTIVGISQNGYDIYILGAIIMNQAFVESEQKGLEKLLKPIFAYLKTIHKTPITVLADSGYDNVFLFHLIHKYGFDFTIKHKNIRTFHRIDDTDSNGTMYPIDEIYNQVEEFESFDFYGHEDRYIGILKYTKCKINGYQDIINVIMFKNEKNGNLYTLLTTNEINSITDAKNSIYRYDRRWKIELIFNFIKDKFHFEKFIVRSLSKIINLLLLIMITSNFYSRIWHSRKSQFVQNMIKNAQSFTDPTFGLELIFNSIKILYQVKIPDY